MSGVFNIFFIFFLDKVVKLHGEGSVINGAYPLLVYHVEQTFNASVCQVYGKYTKTKSEILKHYQEKNEKKNWF